MRVRWYGQSAYLLTAGDRSVLIDPLRPGLPFPVPVMRDIRIAETCVDSLTHGELVGDVPRFFAVLAASKLTCGDIEGSPA
jgi:L-ascorbate metabolism protein UlaG (beta-lactamase superfamily)